MRAAELIAKLDQWDRQGVWIFSRQTMRLMFPDKKGTFAHAIKRHVDAGLVGRLGQGVAFYNPRARSMPSNALEEVALHLRPWAFSYLSLESVLSESGAISQVPGRLTLMTTGRSGIVETPIGTLEFVHTKRRGAKLKQGLQAVDGRPLPIATPARAHRDLRAARRNTQLVNQLA